MHIRPQAAAKKSEIRMTVCNRRARLDLKRSSCPYSFPIREITYAIKICQTLQLPEADCLNTSLSLRRYFLLTVVTSFFQCKLSWKIIHSKSITLLVIYMDKTLHSPAFIYLKMTFTLLFIFLFFIFRVHRHICPLRKEFDFRM